MHSRRRNKTEERERSLESLEKGYELAKKVGDIHMVSFIGSNLADWHMSMGNTNKAISLAEESVALNRKTGNKPNLSFSVATLGSAYQMLGEWDKTEQCYKEAASIAKELNDFQQIAGSYGYLGWLHFDKEEYVKAKKLLEKMCEVFEKAGAKYLQMAFSPPLISTYIKLGEIEKAKALIDNLQNYALEKKDKGLIATADLLRATQFHAQKKWQESVKLYEKSLAEFEALNERRWNAYGFAKRVIYEYALLYLERDQEGDRQKAHELLNQALEIFQKMGAKKDIEKVIAKKKFLTA